MHRTGALLVTTLFCSFLAANSGSNALAGEKSIKGKLNGTATVTLLHDTTYRVDYSATEASPTSARWRRN